jgi:hypothetical protein
MLDTIAASKTTNGGLGNQTRNTLDITMASKMTNSGLGDT